jgi:hypothetical protein
MFFGWGDCISSRPTRNASRFDLPSGEVKIKPQNVCRIWMSIVGRDCAT